MKTTIMKTTLQYLKSIGQFLLLSFVLSACSGDGKFLKDRKYNPINFYFNPNLFWISGSPENPASFVPDFVNYPNDLVKYGLRGPVKSIESNGLFFSEMQFNSQGNLTYQSYFFDSAKRYGEASQFEYTESGNLNSMYNVRRRQGSGASERYEYNASNQLINRVYRGGEKKTYTYHENGLLKSVLLDSNKDNQDVCDMVCDKDGNIISLETFQLTHSVERLLSHGKFAYVYNSDGLCSSSKETLFPRKEYYSIDSICGVSTYLYNDKGDLVQWNYSSTYYPKKTTYAFTIDYVYTYDERSNWIEMKIVGNSVEDILSGFRPVKGEDGKKYVSFNRIIEYYTDEELKAMQKEQEELQEKLLKQEEEREKKPFKGVWDYNGSCDFGDTDPDTMDKITQIRFCLNIDFYEKSVPFEDTSTNGGMFISYGSQSANCTILTFKTEGNKADITYQDPADCIYKAQLVYNNTDKTMKFTDGELLETALDIKEWEIDKYHILPVEFVLPMVVWK